MVRYFMEISVAKETDYKSITKLYYSLYDDKKNTKVFDGINFESKVFIAKENNSIIGFIITTHVNYALSRIGYLDELFVNNDFRNIGAGKKLVNTAAEWQKEMHSEVIFVTTDEAQEFYKKLGFKELRKNSWLCLPLI